MMKRLPLNLLLLAVVVLLLLVALYEPGIQRPVEPPPLLALHADEVDTLSINNHRQQQIILKREGEHEWRMVEPLQVAANRYKVESVLNILEQRPNNRFAASIETLESYGLHKPQVELVLGGHKGEQRLLFGSQTPLDHYRYLQIGSEIMTIEDSAFYPVASLYTNFIAARLLPEGVQISSIQLPDFSISFVDGRWGLESRSEGNTLADGVSADQLARWLDGWRYASSVDIEPITASLSSGQLDEVVITLRSGEQLRWSILQQGDGLILARIDLGIQYRLSDAQRAELFSPPRPEPLQDDQQGSL